MHAKFETRIQAFVDDITSVHPITLIAQETSNDPKCARLTVLLIPPKGTNPGDIVVDLCIATCLAKFNIKIVSETPQQLTFEIMPKKSSHNPFLKNMLATEKDIENATAEIIERVKRFDEFLAACDEALRKGTVKVSKKTKVYLMNVTVFHDNGIVDVHGPDHRRMLEECLALTERARHKARECIDTVEWWTPYIKNMLPIIQLTKHTVSHNSFHKTFHNAYRLVESVQRELSAMTFLLRALSVVQDLLAM